MMMETSNPTPFGGTLHEAHAQPQQSGGLAKVGDVASQAADTAKTVIGQAKDQAVAVAEHHKEDIADRIADVAQAVHRSGEQFEGKQDWIAHAIEQGATELNMLASALRDNDIISLASKVQMLAKRQPALFIGASLMAGFAVARLGKIVVAGATTDDLPTMPRIDHATS
jgi:hypothetical protein